VIEELQSLGREDIMVIAGGVIPTQDYEYLYQTGVMAIFGPGTRVTDTGMEILKVLLEAYG
jgi:methylmalonyl-CoA mutase